MRREVNSSHLYSELSRIMAYSFKLPSPRKVLFTFTNCVSACGSNNPKTIVVLAYGAVRSTSVSQEEKTDNEIAAMADNEIILFMVQI